MIHTQVFLFERLRRKWSTFWFFCAFLCVLNKIRFLGKLFGFDLLMVFRLIGTHLNHVRGLFRLFFHASFLRLNCNIWGFSRYLTDCSLVFMLGLLLHSGRFNLTVQFPGLHGHRVFFNNGTLQVRTVRVLRLKFFRDYLTDRLDLHFNNG